MSSCQFQGCTLSQWHCRDRWLRAAIGQLGYALLPMIARGTMLGLNQPMMLHVLDIEPTTEALNGVKMELIDASFPLLKNMFLKLALTQMLNTNFISTEIAIIKARKLSSALSATIVACDHIHDWVLGTPKDSRLINSQGKRWTKRSKSLMRRKH
ncbi:Malate dehydrogenase, cytoplasmic [Glycine soja]